MVVAGLVFVWWTTTQGPGPDALPVLGTVPSFELVDQTGRTATLSDLAGNPWIADLIFTRCVLSCPRMTARMASLGDDLPPGVRRVSITVDPDHDTPEVLASYAAQHAGEKAASSDGSGPGWLFLTGDRQEIESLATEGFKLGVSRRPAGDPRAEAEPLSHSTRFVLVDGEGRIRGYYDAFDEGSLAELVVDARVLTST